MIGKTEYFFKVGNKILKGPVVDKIGKKLFNASYKWDVTSRLPIDILKKIS